MIVFFLTYEETSARVRHRRERYSGRPRAHCHTGGVSLVGNQVHLLREDGSVFCRRKKCTLFDDNTTPPRLIREDYEVKFLRKLKAQLPQSYISFAGDIVNAKGEVIMQGPKHA